jgi:hypothetical protein
MFKVNDLVRVVDKEARQHGYIGRVEEADPDYSKEGTMYYLSHLTDESGSPFPKEQWDADWFFEDQLAAYEHRPKEGQSLLCIDSHGTGGQLEEGKRYRVLSVAPVGGIYYVTIHIPGKVLPMTWDSGRFALVVPIRARR